MSDFLRPPLAAAHTICPGEGRHSLACRAREASLPDLSAPAPRSGFPYSEPPGRQAFLGLEMHLGCGPTPGTPPSESRALTQAPPAHSAGAPGLLTPHLNVSAGTRREDQAHSPGGGMLSTGFSGPASHRWGEMESPSS